MKKNYVVFDSITEMLAVKQDKILDTHVQSERRFYGCNNLKEAQEYLRQGAKEYETREARELVNKIDIEVSGHHSQVWKPQVYGAYPVVPDYLMGDPMCMRDKMPEERNDAPLRIVLNTSVAAGMNTSTIMRRAAAISAFAMKLSETRPVEVWAMANFCIKSYIKDDVDAGWRVKLDAPINLSQLLAMFTPKGCRAWSFNVFASLGYVVSECYLPFLCGGVDAYGDRDKYVANVREDQKLSLDDIVLDAGILTDCRQIDDNPVQWVHDMLIKYGEQVEE